jgi:hypothetical protein
MKKSLSINTKRNGVWRSSYGVWRSSYGVWCSSMGLGIAQMGGCSYETYTQCGVARKGVCRSSIWGGA